VSKKRAPAQDREHPQGQRKVEDQRQGAHDTELGHGNEALQQQLAPQRAVAQDLQLVRETALPTVEQALLAVQIAPRSADTTQKMLDTVEGSRLSEARRDALMERLQEDQTIADLIGQALEGAFGADTPELRSALWGCMDKSWSALISEGASGDWSADLESSLNESSSSGSLSDRAVSMIGDLSSHFADETLAEQSPSEGISSAVQQFCRSIALLLFWEEEEEEEEGFGVGIPEME
jgi:hypothetical protein